MSSSIINQMSSIELDDTNKSSTNQCPAEALEDLCSNISLCSTDESSGLLKSGTEERHPCQSPIHVSSTGSHPCQSPTPPIDPFVSANIRLTDTDGKYNAYHYVDCDQSSDSATKNTRGIIRTIAGDIVCKTFNFTPEYSDRVSSLEGMRTIFTEAREKCDSNIVSVYLAEEGTLVRVWYHGDDWHISSHKKLDATRSRWGSRESHGELFKAALTWYFHHSEIPLPGMNDPEFDGNVLKCFLTTLRQNRIYTFVVRSTEGDRVVCAPLDHPMLYFAGEFEYRMDESVEYRDITSSDPPSRLCVDDLDPYGSRMSRADWVLLNENTSGIDRPDKLEFQNSQELLDFVDTLDPFRAQGVLIYYGEDTLNHGSIKIISAAYQYWANVRGNDPSIRFRYLQLRNDHSMAAALRSLYPSFRDSFNEYETILSDIREDIYEGYIARYINHEYVVMPQELWYIARALHDEYIADPVRNRINATLVANYIDSLSPVRLNFIIRSWKQRQADMQEE